MPEPAPTTDRVTRLRVGDESFLVASMIERCPKLMMLRELVRNALEAAATAPAGARQVRLSGIPIDGVAKLAIWNTGRGLDRDELFRMCDIASSIRKEQRLDRNFGMGAKVASLPSNRHGLRYRSCHAGIVHEVLLGYRDGTYGRLRRAGPDGAWHDVVVATADAVGEGRELSYDWTEVVLFGNEPEQDTVNDPYLGAPSMPGYWLAEELAYRFYRIDEGVELLLDTQGGRRFEPLAERIPRDYSRSSSVRLPDGVVLHYVHDAPLPDSAGQSAAGRNALFPVHGACGLVHKDELYDLHRWHEWLHVAPVFGIPFAARGVSVFIELPDGYAVLPDGYRQFLRHAGDAQAQVGCRDFAQAIHRNRPDWLIEIIDGQAPAATMPGELYADLGRLLRSLKVRRRQRALPTPSLRWPPEPPRLDQEAMPADADRAGAGAPDAAPADASVPAGPQDPGEDIDVEPPPEILMLRDEHEIEARGITRWAGRYYPETHQLFLNGLYPAVADMRQRLQTEFAWARDGEAVRSHALRLAEQSMAGRIGRLLVFALSKHGSWHDSDMHHSVSVQTLSLVAEDYAPSLPAARASLQAMLDRSHAGADRPGSGG